MGLSAKRFAACVAALLTTMFAHAADDVPLLLSSTAATSPGAGSSGDELQEIVVTAQRRRLNLRSMQLDDARDRELLPKLGASDYGLDQQAIDTLPQGKNTPIDKVLLQAPGVSYDSAISNPDFHVRNEYANVQYRINGIQLPDGVSALGPVLETGFIGRFQIPDVAGQAPLGDFGPAELSSTALNEN